MTLGAQLAVALSFPFIGGDNESASMTDLTNVSMQVQPWAEALAKTKPARRKRPKTFMVFATAGLGLFATEFGGFSARFGEYFVSKRFATAEWITYVHVRPKGPRALWPGQHVPFEMTVDSF